MHAFHASHSTHPIHSQLLDILNAESSTFMNPFASMLSSALGMPQPSAMNPSTRQVKKHKHEKGTNASALCYDCAWQINSTKKRHDALKALFSKVEEICINIHDAYDNGEDSEFELADLELILVLASQLSTYVSHPDLLDLRNVHTMDAWIQELMDNGLPAALHAMLQLNDGLPEKFYDKNDYCECIPYYCCNIIATLIQLKVPNHLMGREHAPTEEIRKKMIEANIHMALAPLCSPELSGPLENIKAMAALRRLIDSTCVKELVDKTEFIDSCATILEDSKSIVKSAYDCGFKDYELVLLSLGVNDCGVTSVAPLSLSQSEAYKRCLLRCGALETNASAILSEIAEFSHEYREMVQKKHLLELTLPVLINPVDEEYKLNEHFPSSAKVLAAWLQDEEGIKILRSKVDLREMIHLASTHGDNFNRALFYQHLSPLIMNGGEEVARMLESSTYAIYALLTALEAPVELLRESSSSTLAEFCRYDFGAKLIGSMTTRSHFEQMLRQVPPSEWTYHNLLRIVRHVLKHYPQWKVERLDWNSAEALECKERGNKFFRQGKYKEALKRYAKGLSHLLYKHTASLELPSILHANMSECQLRLAEVALQEGKTEKRIKLLREATISASYALSLNNNNYKAFFRRGKAFFELHRYIEALNDFYCVQLNVQEEGMSVASNISKARKCITCVSCKRVTRKIFLCQRCKKQRYCSEACQKKHWDASHQRDCG